MQSLNASLFIFTLVYLRLAFVCCLGQLHFKIFKKVTFYNQILRKFGG